MVKQRNGRGKLENEGLFIVEEIIDRRRVEENRLQYLIKWKDYPSLVSSSIKNFIIF